jgi:hypothetical protein
MIMRKTEEEELKFNVVEITFDDDESFEAKLNEQYTGLEEPVASFVRQNKYYYLVFKAKDDGKYFRYIRPTEWQSAEVYGKFQHGDAQFKVLDDETIPAFLNKQVTLAS